MCALQADLLTFQKHRQPTKVYCIEKHDSMRAEEEKKQSASGVQFLCQREINITRRDRERETET